MLVNGQAVRAARDAKNLSRETLARQVDVSTSTIERIEQGRPGKPAADTIYLIARTLDVPVESLFTEGDPVA